MTPERLGEDPTVLSECLPVSSVVVRFDHAIEPPELFEGVGEPFVIVQYDPGSPACLLVRGQQRSYPTVRLSPVRLYGPLDGGNRGPNLGERILFEKNEAVAPAFEPVDQLVEPQRRSPDVDLGTRKGHFPARGPLKKSVAAPGFPLEQSSPKVSVLCASGEYPTAPSSVR